MLPESQDNYGSESCSILCLHPLISSPPVLVIATNGGNLNHCVVLNRDDRETEVDEVRSQVSDWSISTTYGGGSESGLSLFVYETVELELGLKMGRKAGDGEEKTDPVKPFDYPIMLHPDPTSPARYFCSHKAGVHCIGLPMVTELAKIAQSPGIKTTTFFAELLSNEKYIYVR